MGWLLHILACLLGTGSWIAINGVWVELPLIVLGVPEGWLLPSYFTIIIQLANVGPLLVTLLHRFLPGRLREVPVISALLALGSLACLLLAFFWQETSTMAGPPHSVAFLSLLFFLALVDCTSSVTFLPYMRKLRAQYLTTYFMGEGLSGLLPGLVALGQGVSLARCVVNGSDASHAARREAEYQAPRFSVRVFFLFLSTMMATCLAAFTLLHYLLAARQEHAKEKYQARVQVEHLNEMHVAVEERPMISSTSPGSPLTSSTYSWPQRAYIFGALAWVNALTNGALPAVQSYSCLPYGNFAYHLSATLAALANPLACFIGMFLPSR